MWLIILSFILKILFEAKVFLQKTLVEPKVFFKEKTLGSTRTFSNSDSKLKSENFND